MQFWRRRVCSGDIGLHLITTPWINHASLIREQIPQSDTDPERKHRRRTRRETPISRDGY